jgi:hypothetical protein
MWCTHKNTPNQVCILQMKCAYGPLAERLKDCYSHVECEYKHLFMIYLEDNDKEKYYWCVLTCYSYEMMLNPCISVLDFTTMNRVKIVPLSPYML